MPTYQVLARMTDAFSVWGFEGLFCRTSLNRADAVQLKISGRVVCRAEVNELIARCLNKTNKEKKVKYRTFASLFHSGASSLQGPHHGA